MWGTFCLYQCLGAHAKNADICSQSPDTVSWRAERCFVSCALMGVMIALGVARRGGNVGPGGVSYP